MLGEFVSKRYTPVSAADDVEAALRLLEGRWKLVILFHLFGGMEADGIVHRTAYPQVPPKVEYRLTDWGQSLCPALNAILKWADRRPQS
jgi:DNA-binding HxlR family transcriptional regulator